MIIPRWEPSNPLEEVFLSWPRPLRIWPLFTPAGTMGSNPGGFNLPSESYSGPFIAHTIFDRTLLRAGETVHMKHIFRQHTMKGFSLVPNPQMPDLVSIEHYGSGQKYEFPLKWDANGMAETTWAIPKEAKLGNYEVRLLKKLEGEQKRTSYRRGPSRMDFWRIQGGGVSGSSLKRGHPAAHRTVDQCQRGHPRFERSVSCRRWGRPSSRQIAKRSQT